MAVVGVVIDCPVALGSVVLVVVSTLVVGAAGVGVRDNAADDEDRVGAFAILLSSISNRRRFSSSRFF